MRYLFIHFTKDVLGGIETLIGRMSGHLISRNDEVNVITTSARKWAPVLPGGVSCVELGRGFRNLFYPGLAQRTWTRCGFDQPDVIMTFDLPTSWCGSILACSGKRKIRMISGIYNPYVFDTSRGAQVLMNGWYLYLRNYLRNIAPCSRLACDPRIIAELTTVHGPAQTAHMWPLPVDATPFRNISRHPEWGHIVSVGRLAPMKEYNFYMVDVVRELRQRGHEVRWTVYGSGPYETQVRDYVAQQGMERWISLRGDIPYAKLGMCMEPAHVFVGMGTSLIEASLCGVPNVVAVAYDRSGMTYGPLYNLPHGVTGQKLDYEPARRVTDEIERLLRMSKEDYARESNRVREYAQYYDMERVMSQFHGIVEQALPPTYDPLLYSTNYLYAAARSAGVHLDRLLLPRRRAQTAS